MYSKISYFLDDKLNVYQTPSSLEDFFLSRKFHKIDIDEIKKNRKKNFFTKIRKKILGYFSILKKIRFILSPLTKKELMIIDDITGELSFLLSKKNFYSLHSRFTNLNRIYINYDILKFILLNFFKRKLKLNYLIAIIENINPKVVLTFIDNSNEFHFLSKFFDKRIDFFAIQNASRGDYNFASQSQIKKIFFQKLFCLGGFDIEFLKNLKITGKFKEIGSFRTSIFITKFKDDLNQKKIFDICLIGKNLVKIVHSDKPYEDTIIPETLIFLENLKKYIREKNLSLVICCKNYGFKQEAEELFYKKFFDLRNITISSNGKDVNDSNYFNSYKNIIKSEIVIGLNSTILREAFFFDKKILCVDFSQKIIHPFKDISLCNSKSFKDFELKIDQLSKMTHFDYLKKLNYPKNYIITKSDTIHEINTSINNGLNKKCT